MKLKCRIILALLYVSLLILFLFNPISQASTFNAISVQNYVHQSIITIKCNVVPVYTIFSVHNPERIVIDFEKISKICNNNVFPIKFVGNNLVVRIRANFSVDSKTMRIVLDLYCESNITVITQKKAGKDYCIILTISKKIIPVINNNTYIINNMHYLDSVRQFNTILHKQSSNLVEKQITLNKFNIERNRNSNCKKLQTPIIVAIDAGHGGQDPGATGYRGIFEKNITLNIAKKLKKILDKDPIFTTVMIRDGDYFLSVMERSDLARKRKANILVSIHVDSALNSRVKGASVWILSNRRAKSETIHWLHRSDKHSELLGGLGDVLINYRNDPYFNHLVLDLQFGYAQREGYNIAMHILNQLRNISFLHKNTPEYSNFGILRSPDIPSVLVEIGFISNFKEACLLITNGYQEKIAWALYKGLRSYIIEHQKKI